MITSASPTEARRGQAKLFGLIAVLFFVLTAGIASFALYVVFARASVVVLSEQQDIETDFLVDVSQSSGENEVLGGTYEAAKTATRTFPSSSVVTIDTRAEGRVKVTSTLARSQTLVATTRIVTPDDIMFRLDRHVVVPAFGSVEVDVYADEPGADGAIGDATFTIPGLNPDTRRHFTVETVEPIEGGEREVRMVTTQDILNADKAVRARLEEEVALDLRKMARKDDLLFDGEIIEFEAVDVKTDVSAGEEVEEFTMTMTLRGSAVFYDRTAFKERVRQFVRDRLPFDRQLTQLDEEGMKVGLEKCDTIGGRANLRVQARGASVISPDAAGLDEGKLVGVTVDAATQYLQSLDGVSSASVKMRPFWARRLPNKADHIKVEVR